MASYTDNLSPEEKMDRIKKMDINLMNEDDRKNQKDKFYTDSENLKKDLNSLLDFILGDIYRLKDHITKIQDKVPVHIYTAIKEIEKKEIEKKEKITNVQEYIKTLSYDEKRKIYFNTVNCSDEMYDILIQKIPQHYINKAKSNSMEHLRNKNGRIASEYDFLHKDYLTFLKKHKDLTDFDTGLKNLTENFKYPMFDRIPVPLIALHGGAKYIGRKNTNKSSKRPNSKRANSKRANSKKANSKRANSKKANSKRANSKRANSKRANSKRANSKRANSKRANSKKANLKRTIDV
jgi:hypothetical protein